MKSDVDKALKSISLFQRKQIPFAAALGLTNTAKKVMQVEKRMMVKQLGRPTPFTVRGIRYQGARKADYKLGRLHSRVFIADLQAEYLHYQILGGTRTPQGRAIPVPSETSMATYRVARAALRTCSSRRVCSKARSMAYKASTRDPREDGAAGVAMVH